jgi:predicted ribosome quality control (RQC) complex YloA/Tae2 family protein
VGRNARGNRILTFQVAKGHDWWMHLRDRPGAHLVIPTPKGQSPPLELLLAAAQIALTVAQFEIGEAAEVQYTRIRDVRAIAGEDGLVTVRAERVLRVVRDPAALAGWMPIDDP